MDRVYIEDLEVYAYHGVNIEEKSLGQKFYISLTMYLELREAGIKDDLSSTVNYGEVCTSLERLFKSNKFDLIEAAAENVADFILKKYERVKRVKVKIKKPSAPIPCHLNFAAVEIDRSWHTSYIALGSNMGDKKNNIEMAIKEMGKSDMVRVVKVAPIYETKPVGYVEQENFLNCAIEVKTLMLPAELMSFLLNIEKVLKRERIIKWGPRTIDLDILLYDDAVTSTREVIIPHPRMHERLFVLEPLSSIAPYIVHPILNKRIIELRDQLSKEQELI
jgi:dihydroneopterin aldolase / 2-amino-4-hydroxy-6-hydroxymethyldihydropteridine diphosphokinase